MKSFPVALLIYTVTVLALAVAIVHFTFARPINSRLRSMDSNLQNIETDLQGELSTIGYQLEALNTKLSLRAQTPVDIIESAEMYGERTESATDDFDLINHNIDQILSDASSSTFPTPRPAEAERVGGPTPVYPATGGAIGGAIASTGPIKVAIKSYQINSIKVYQDPNTNSEVLGSILYGDTYPAVSRIPDWYQITLNNQATGWVQAQHVKEVN